MAKMAYEPPQELMSALTKLEHHFPDVMLQAVTAAAGVLEGAIKARMPVDTGALKAKTSRMYPGLRKGVAVCSVRFTGHDPNPGKHIRENKHKGLPNWMKAMFLEYGTSKMQARPFVSPAIAACSAQMSRAVENIIDEYQRKLI